MKGFMLFLTGAAILAVPAAARALPVDTVFQVSIMDGFDPGDANGIGAVTFKLDSDQGASCRYRSSWDGAWEGSIVTGCVLDERKTHGHRSCTANAAVTFSTFVVNDPRSTCTLPTSFGTRQDAHLVVGGEVGPLNGIIGIIQWTAAAPILSVFEAQKYP